MAKEAVEIQVGSKIDLTLTEDVSVGDVVPLGTDMISIATVSGLTGEVIAVETEKVWEITAKTADAIAVGDVVYFDATAREITTTATDNIKAGKAVTSKTAVAGTINVKLNV